jgi:uncharacterized membrane-anchored protein
VIRTQRRRFLRRPSRTAGVARVDRRTKDLVLRAQPGDIAVIDHEDIDRVAAEGLVAAGVSAVVNARSSISGRYPNLGPLILLEAGIPLVDGVGQLIIDKVREGSPLSLDGDCLFVDERLVGVGQLQTVETILLAMDAAKSSLDERFETFAENTIEYMHRERDLLFGGAGLPPLDHDLSGRPVLVVVRGYGYREDLDALRAYIRDVRPVLVGVDGGADALVDAGYSPDLVIGDMDSVTDRTLLLARKRFRRRQSMEVVLHAYPGGTAPGRERLERLGVPFKVVEAVGTSEDLAMLLAHERRAELIVAVGSHGNLREFLDKGREGMSSTFLVRLRVGEILMDAKGVSRLYGARSFKARDAWLLVGSGFFAMFVVIWVSPPLRLYADHIFGQIHEILRHLIERL